jgi:hypothetical protein
VKTNSLKDTRTMALLLALLALTVVALAPSRAAAADVTGGEAVWGFKESWRSYVLNAPPAVPPASITTSNGATQAPDNGPFTFVNGTGQLDPDADTAGLDFTGTVTFSKPAHGINIVLENPRIEYSGDAGVLIADVTENGTPHPDTNLANLNLAGHSPTITDTSVSLTEVPATMAAEGSSLFGGFYTEGTELDPVSFTVAGDFSTTPPPVDPYPEPKAVGKVKPGKANQKLKKSRTVKLGKVTCQVAECDVTAPNKLKGKIKGGKRKGKLELKVTAPDTLAEGESATVTAKASKKSAKAVKGGTAKLKGKLKLTGDGTAVSGKIKVNVKG